MSKKYHSFSWNDEKSKFCSPWKDLVDEQRLNPSLLPQWLEAAVSSHGLFDSIKIFSETSDNTVLGILPYIIQKRPMNRLQLRWLEPAFNLISYHPDLICSSASENLLSELLLQTNQHWDVAYIHNVSTAGRAAQQLEALSKKEGNVLLTYPGETSPYLRLQGTWKEYLAIKGSSFRYRLKRRVRKIEKSGELTIHWYRKGDDTKTLLSEILSIEEGSRKVAANMAITQRSEEIEYYRRLLPFLSDTGLLFANVLHIDGTPVAYSLCYNDKGVIGQLKTSFLDSHRNLAPGAVVIESAIKKSFDIGALEFDFLGDIMPHKMEWSDGFREHNSYYLFSRRLPVHMLGHAKKLGQTLKNKLKKEDPSKEK